jgi:uncharacterized protein YcnI
LRRVVTPLAAFVVLVAWAAPALAHVALMPAEVGPGETVDARLVVTHGCGPEGEMPASAEEMSPIVGVTLEVPEGITVTPHEVDGWPATTVEEDGRRLVRWVSADPAGVAEGLLLDVGISASGVADGTELTLPVVQDCLDGTSMAWTEAGDPSAVTYPAATLLVTSPASAAGDEGLSTGVIVALAAGIGLLAGAVVFVLSGRRT